MVAAEEDKAAPPRLARRRALSPVGERVAVELAVDGASRSRPCACAPASRRRAAARRAVLRRSGVPAWPAACRGGTAGRSLRPQTLGLGFVEPSPSVLFFFDSRSIFFYSFDLRTNPSFPHRVGGSAAADVPPGPATGPNPVTLERASLFSSSSFSQLGVRAAGGLTLPCRPALAPFSFSARSSGGHEWPRRWRRRPPDPSPVRALTQGWTRRRRAV